MKLLKKDRQYLVISAILLIAGILMLFSVFNIPNHIQWTIGFILIVAGSIVYGGLPRFKKIVQRISVPFWLVGIGALILYVNVYSLDKLLNELLGGLIGFLIIGFFFLESLRRSLKD